MKALSASPVEDAHAYTRLDLPWVMTVGETAYGKMINYLSGGGMKTFGRTVQQERARRRQRAFLAVSAVVIALWFVFLFV